LAKVVEITRNDRSKGRAGKEKELTQKRVETHAG